MTSSPAAEPFWWTCLYVFNPIELAGYCAYVAYLGPQNYPLLAALAAYCFLVKFWLDRYDVEQRTEYQHHIICFVRDKVIGNGKRGRRKDTNALEVDLTAWAKYGGWRGSIPVMTIIVVLLAVNDWRQGKYIYSLHHITGLVYYYAAYLLGKRNHMTLYHRSLVCRQCLYLAFIPNSQVIFHRALFARVFVASYFSENIDEMLVGFLPFMVWSGKVWPIISIFIFLLVPIEFFGIRSVVASRFMQVAPTEETTTVKHLQSSRSGLLSNRLVLYVGGVPLGTMIYSLNQLDRSNDSNLQSSLRPGSLLICVFLLGVACVSIVFNDRIDGIFSPTTLRHRQLQPRTANKKADDTIEDMTTSEYLITLQAAWCLTLLAALGQLVAVQSFSHLGSMILVISVYILQMSRRIDLVGRIAVSIGYSAGRITRWIIISMHLVLLGVADQSLAESSLPILLALVQAMLIFDEASTLSELLIDLSFPTGIQLTIMQSMGAVTQVSPVFLLSACSALMAVASVSSVERKMQLFENIQHGENFLDHALKQKYSGIGTALESILDNNQHGESTIVRQLLEEALEECHIGRDIMYMAAFVRKSFMTPLLANSQPIAVVTLLRDWTKNRTFREIDFDEIDLKHITITADRDLLRALLTNLSGVPSETVLTVSRHVHPESTPRSAFSLCFAISHLSASSTNDIESSNKREGDKGHGGTRSTFASKGFLANLRDEVVRVLGGQLQTDSLDRKLLIFNYQPRSPFRLATGSLGISPALAKRSLPSPAVAIKRSRTPSFPSDGPGIPSPRSVRIIVPPQLGFAVLDDNDLVRRNCLRLILTHLKGDPTRTFASGQTKEEAIFFPHEIFSRHIDIAIFDENLEYDSDKPSMKGTELAKIAVSRGFTGCLLLHSANGDLAANLPSYFHGFIEKTSKREEFLQGVAVGWGKYLESTGKNPMGGNKPALFL